MTRSFPKLLIIGCFLFVATTVVAQTVCDEFGSCSTATPENTSAVGTLTDQQAEEEGKSSSISCPKGEIPFQSTQDHNEELSRAQRLGDYSCFWFRKELTEKGGKGTSNGDQALQDTSAPPVTTPTPPTTPGNEDVTCDELSGCVKNTGNTSNGNGGPSDADIGIGDGDGDADEGAAPANKGGAPAAQYCTNEAECPGSDLGELEQTETRGLIQGLKTTEDHLTHAKQGGLIKGIEGYEMAPFDCRTFDDKQSCANYNKGIEAHNRAVKEGTNEINDDERRYFRHINGISEKIKEEFVEDAKRDSATNEEILTSTAGGSCESTGSCGSHDDFGGIENTEDNELVHGHKTLEDHLNYAKQGGLVEGLEGFQMKLYDCSKHSYMGGQCEEYNSAIKAHNRAVREGTNEFNESEKKYDQHIKNLSEGAKVQLARIAERDSTIGGSCENTGSCGGDGERLSDGGVIDGMIGQYVQPACPAGQTCTLTDEQKTLIAAHNRAVDEDRDERNTNDPVLRKELDNFNAQTVTSDNRTVIPEMTPEQFFKAKQILKAEAGSCPMSGGAPNKDCVAAAQAFFYNYAAAGISGNRNCANTWAKVLRWNNEFCGGHGGLFEAGAARARGESLVPGSQEDKNLTAALQSALTRPDDLAQGRKWNWWVGSSIPSSHNPDRASIIRTGTGNSGNQLYLKAGEAAVDRSQFVYGQPQAASIVPFDSSDAQDSGRVVSSDGSLIPPYGAPAQPIVPPAHTPSGSRPGTGSRVQVTSPLGTHTFRVPSTGNPTFDRTFSNALSLIANGGRGNPMSVFSGLMGMVGASANKSLSSAGLTPSTLASALIPNAPKELDSIAPGLSGAINNFTKALNPLSTGLTQFLTGGNGLNLSTDQLRSQLQSFGNQNINELQTLLRQNASPERLRSAIDRQLRDLGILSGSIGSNPEIQRQISGLQSLLGDLEAGAGSNQVQNALNGLARSLGSDTNQRSLSTLQSRATAAGNLYNLLRQQGQELDQLDRNTGGIPSFSQLRNQISKQNDELRRFASQNPAADQNFIQQMIRENEAEINDLQRYETSAAQDTVTEAELQSQIGQLTDTIDALQRQLDSSTESAHDDVNGSSNLTVTALKATKAGGDEYRFRGSIRRTITDGSNSGNINTYFGNNVVHELVVDYGCDGSVDTGVVFATPYYSILPRTDGAEVLLSEYLKIPRDGLHCFAFSVDIDDVIDETNERDNTSEWREFIAGFGASTEDSTSLPPLNFEVAVYTENYGGITQNWTDQDVVISADQELAFRWDAPEYRECVPLVSSMTAGSAANTDPVDRNTRTENIEIHEHTGYYELRCVRDGAARVESVHVVVSDY